MPLVCDNYVITTPNVIKEPEECLGRTLFSHMNTNKDKIAQIDAKTGVEDTFGDLLQRSIRTALHMKSKNLSREHVITLCTKNHLETAVPYIAAQFLGIRVASIDPSLSPREISQLLGQVEPRMLFVDSESVVPKVDFDSEVVVFGGTTKHTPFDTFLSAHEDEDSFEPVEIENLQETALIHFSGGTTGVPKGICLSHYSILAQILNSRLPDTLDMEYMKNVSKRITFPLTRLCYSTMHWLSGSAMVIGCILEGHSRLICPDFDGCEIWDFIRKYKPFMLMLTPVQAIEMIANRRKEVDVDSILYIGIVGSGISKDYCLEMKEIFPGADIVRGYGQTECSGVLTMFKPSDVHCRSLMTKDEKIESVGLPLRGVTYRVVDLESGKNLGPNQKGELRIKSKFVMNGYHNLDSSEVFDEDGWLKTGDVVYYDDDYCFYVVDRIKEAIKYKGWFIAPSHVESELEKHPAVKLAAVVGVFKDDGQQYPMGLVVLNEGFDVSEEEVEKFVESRVSEIQQLRAGVKFVKSLPLTVTGKVDRKGIKKMVSEGRF